MVQFRSKMDTKGSGYWKLSSSPGIVRKMHAELANFGTTYPAKTPKRRLRKIHERSQRGLLVYDICGVGDLRRFCTARRIQVGPEMDKDKLIERLEYADDQAVFSRLYDLPAELRVLVYELYIESLDWETGIAPEPPLTKVSRLTRRETLPVFYQSCHFSIGGSTRMTAGKIDQDVLDKLQKLHVSGYINHPGGRSFVTYVLGRPAQDMDLQICPVRGSECPDSAKRILKARLKALAVVFEQRGARLHLKYWDDDELLAVFRAIR